MRSTLIVAVAVAALALAGVASAQTYEPTATSAVHGLRHAISWHRSMTWRWQDRAGLARTRASFAERRTRSVAFLRWIDRTWSARRVAARHRYLAAVRSARSAVRSAGGIPALICSVFGAANCSEALAIAKRESDFSTHPYPPNPTHFGIFQLDASAIAAYARGRYSTALDQVRAAFRMFLSRGWEPWTCCEG